MAIQMTCPFCKKEFPFYNGELDSEISKLGQEIAAIDKELSLLKLSYPVDRKYKAALVAKKAKKVQRITELKSVRKAADQQRERMEFDLFKLFVSERHGNAEFHAILSLVEEALEAYSISGTMRHEYTRSNKLSSVTSINKL